MMSVFKGTTVQKRPVVSVGMILVFFLLNFALNLLAIDGRLGRSGDNASYIILAESLQSGRGYVLDNGPQDMPMRMYPPLFPFALAMIVQFLGRNIVAFKLVSALSIAGVTAAVAVTFRRYFRYETWLWFCTLVAVNPMLVDYGHQILSEALFTLLVMLSLGFYLSGHKKKAYIIVSFMFAGLCFLTRTAGVALVAAFVVYLAVKRHFARLGLFLAIFLAIGGWWFLISNSEYIHAAHSVNPYDPSAGSAGIGTFMMRGLINTAYYFQAELPKMFFYAPVRGAEFLGFGNNLFVIVLRILAAVAIIVPAGYGYYCKVRRHVNVMDIFLPIYLGMIMLYSVQDREYRFLVPVVPLVLFYFTGGMESFANHRVLKRKISVLVFSVIFLCSAAGSAAVIYKRRSGYDRADFIHMDRAVDYVKQHSEPGQLLACAKPETVWLKSGVHTIEIPHEPDTGALIRYFEKVHVNWVIVDGLNYANVNELFIKPAIADCPGCFKLSWSTEPPVSKVYRFIPRCLQDRTE